MPLRTTLFWLTFSTSFGALANGGSPIPPPKTPRGLPRCESPLVPLANAVDLQGERIEYDLEIMGVDVGTLRLQTGRRGTHQGAPATEYTSQLDVNRGVAMMVPLEGSAATLMSDVSQQPLQSAHRYRWAMVSLSETKTFSNGSRHVMSRQVDGDEKTQQEREFGTPVQDLLSGVYYLRRLPRDAEGCTVLYANQKAFTVWLDKTGEELVSTPWGKRMADRYEVRYSADVYKTVKKARFWVSQDALRVPYKAEAVNNYAPRATLKGYKTPLVKS